MPVLYEHLTRARHALAAAGIDEAESAIDAELLARHVLGLDRAQLLTKLRSPAPARFEARFDALVARRVTREPLAYIVAHREFWGREFEVTPAVLIPRPETEVIMEEAIADSPDGGWKRIIDVGTGSGCLAVTLGLEFREAQVIATDVSPAALAVARRNAARHGVAARISFVEADLLDGVQATADLIVSNPPYIPDNDIPRLQPEVRDFEPVAALAGGESDGLATIRRLCASAPLRLAPGGTLVVEFGFGQEAGVREAAGASGWRVDRIRPDLQGIPRTAVLRR